MCIAQRLEIIATYVRSSMRHAVYLDCALVAPLILLRSPETVSSGLLIFLLVVMWHPLL